MRKPTGRSGAWACAAPHSFVVGVVVRLECVWAGRGSTVEAIREASTAVGIDTSEVPSDGASEEARHQPSTSTSPVQPSQPSYVQRGWQWRRRLYQ